MATGQLFPGPHRCYSTTTSNFLSNGCLILTSFVGEKHHLLLELLTRVLRDFRSSSSVKRKLQFPFIRPLRQLVLHIPLLMLNSDHILRFNNILQGVKSGGEMESAQAKNEALRAAGAVVPTSFETFEDVIKETFKNLLKRGRLHQLKKSSQLKSLRILTLQL